jgi:hypothetical protein
MPVKRQQQCDKAATEKRAERETGLQNNFRQAAI